MYKNYTTENVTTHHLLLLLLYSTCQRERNNIITEGFYNSIVSKNKK